MRFSQNLQYSESINTIQNPQNTGEYFYKIKNKDLVDYGDH